LSVREGGLYGRRFRESKPDLRFEGQPAGERKKKRAKKFGPTEIERETNDRQ